MKLHQQVVEEGVTRRQEFDDCLTSFLEPLAALEKKCEGLELSGESQPLKVQEKVEAVRVRGYTFIILTLLNFELHPFEL